MSPGAGGLGVVIVAAGSGIRFGAPDKAFAPLGGRPLLHHSLERFAGEPDVVGIVLVLGAHTLARGAELARDFDDNRVVICAGGETRGASARSGLVHMPVDVEMIAVHDAARPFATSDLIGRVLDAARANGAAAPAIPVADTIHAVDDNGIVEGTLDRDRLRAVQTPQIARRDWLERALRYADDATDEIGLLFAAGYRARLVDGDPRNIKITWPGDLAIAEAILALQRTSP